VVSVADDMPVVESLDELAALLERAPGLYVRWSRGPDTDTPQSSTDDLTGARMPGLSAHPLRIEDWWEGPARLWAARRLVDYSHLAHEKGPGVRPWVLEGDELGRGPDDEPLVRCERPLAWVADRVLDEAQHMIDDADGSTDWGPMRRRPGGEG
jgi:hypothetical protein